MYNERERERGRDTVLYSFQFVDAVPCLVHKVLVLVMVCLMLQNVRSYFRYLILYSNCCKRKKLS